MLDSIANDRYNTHQSREAQDKGHPSCKAILFSDNSASESLCQIGLK